MSKISQIAFVFTAVFLAGCKFNLGFASFDVNGSLFKDKAVVTPLDPIAVSFSIGTPFSSNELTGTAKIDLGLCRRIEITAMDKRGNKTTVLRNTTVAIDNLLSAQLFSDENCVSQITSLNFAARSQSATAYLRDNAIDNLVLKTRSPGFVATERNIKVEPTIVQVDFSQSSTSVLALNNSVTAGRCTELFVIPSRGDRAVVNIFDARLYPFNVSLTGDGYFSDVDCTVPRTSMALSDTAASRRVYYKNNNLNSNVTIEAIPLAGNVGAPITTSAKKAAKALAIASGPVKIAIVVTEPILPVGVCREVDLQLQDLNGMTTSDGLARVLATTAKFNGTIDAGEIYTSLANCEARTSPMSSANINFAAGVQNVKIGFRITNINVVNDTPVLLRATTLDLTEGTKLLTAKVDAREILVGDADASPARNKLCNGPYRVEVNDGRGRDFATSVTLQSDVANFEFYNDPACSSAASTTAFNVPAAGAILYTREPGNATVANITLKAPTMNGFQATKTYQQTLTQPLQPDLDFNQTGKRIDATAFPIVVNGMAAQGTKTLVVGNSTRASATHGFIRRYNSDGSADNNFGNAGEMYLIPASSTGSTANAVAVDAQNNIYIVGKVSSTTLGAGDDIMLVRIASNGVITRKNLDLGALDEGFAIALTSGSIVIGGKRMNASSGSIDAVVALFAISSFNLVWDTEFSFGDSGDSEVRSLTTSADAIFATGNVITGGVGIAKFQPANGGILANRNQLFPGLVADSRGIVLQPNGRVIVGGSATGGASGTRDVLLSGYSAANLAIDTTFGDGTGKALIPTTAQNEQVNAIAVVGTGNEDPDSGKIVVTGTDSTNPFVQRYNSLGFVESDGANPIRARVDFGGTDASKAILLRTGGKIQIAGDNGASAVGIAAFLR